MVGGTFWPSEQHTQEAARHSPESQQDLGLMVFVVLSPSGPVGEVQGLHPKGVQNTRNILTLAMTGRVGSREAWEGSPWL